MALVVIFEEGKEPVVLESADTNEHIGKELIAINPDLSAVLEVPRRYWKQGEKDQVVEMEQLEKDAVDAKLLQERDTRIETLNEIPTQVLAEFFIQQGTFLKDDLTSFWKGKANG